MLTVKTTEKQYYSRGKLLLSGEYLVLSGAKALGVPLKSGQELRISPITGNWIQWDSRELGRSWFHAKFSLDGTRIFKCSDEGIASRLSEILTVAGRMQKEKKSIQACEAITDLEFPRNYGWGSSSTLVVNIAHWFGIDPMDLHFETSKGSGYDVAVAMAGRSIMYQLREGRPCYHPVKLSGRITPHLYFVYLGQKQDTRKSIEGFNKHRIDDRDLQVISGITERMAETSDPGEFQDLMEEHEAILSGILEQPGIQKQSFDDFDGCIKSLGAWGGDFVMACSGLKEERILEYFSSRGYPVVYPYRKIVHHE